MSETSKAKKTNSRNGSPGEQGRVAGRVTGELCRDTGQLARRARPRHDPARPASTAVLPVESPASSAVTRASSPGEHDRVAIWLAGELDRAADRLARRA
ncbi:hypothetical protein F2Q68_00044101 [Brassica cretica]|uniref:Uncharacterized protein n=1 Tax=Brassica cretica TaxID=69181 RepID=A0A8S9LVK5_BRACR|nr:hypothetical protein F2Q68_00044101 [Brassica cretica]